MAASLSGGRRQALIYGRLLVALWPPLPWDAGAGAAADADADADAGGQGEGEGNQRGRNNNSLLAKAYPNLCWPPPLRNWRAATGKFKSKQIYSAPEIVSL